MQYSIQWSFVHIKTPAGVEVGKKNEIGRSHGGCSTQIHACVDSQGFPHQIASTQGQAHDLSKAHDFLTQAQGRSCIADRAYDANHFVEASKQKD